MGALKNTYHINQCALFKIGSKKRLAALLNVSVNHLLAIEKKPVYRIFLLPQHVCPFTGKVTKARLVQEPTEKLRKIHERIQSLLMRVTPPSYAHAAVKGRSYRTNAAVHTHGKWVATFDITKFYPSTPESKIFDFFAVNLNCAPDVARILTNLACYRPLAPGSRPGLPTGSPLSPILSVYANIALFDALETLAKKHKLNFTCYVDDVTFSGDLLPPGLTRIVRSIMRKHGHNMSEKKTRIFGPDQAKHVTGVVLRSGKIYVPYSRFKKARRIQLAIQDGADTTIRVPLRRKLAGLLGEAAFLDKRYTSWARASYKALAIECAVPQSAPSS